MKSSEAKILHPNLRDIARRVEKADEFAFDIECFSPEAGAGKLEHLDPFKTQIVGCSIAVGDEAWYIPFGVDPKTGREYAALTEFEEEFHNAFNDPDKKAVAWNAKFDWKILGFNDVHINNTLTDPMIASYLIDENFPHNLKDTCARELGIRMKRIHEVWEDPYSQEFFDYGHDDALYTLRLWKEIFEPGLQQEGMEKPFWAFKMPAVKIAAEMEITGLLMDVNYIAEYTVQAEKRLEEIQEELRELAGEEFNLSSPKQIGKIMFGEGDDFGLGLPRELTSQGKPIGKKGVRYWKTGVDILQRLALLDVPAAAFPKGILEFRKIDKRIGTYCKPYLEEHTKTGDGRVHCSFNTIGTETGRWSCRNPNLQNLPRAAKEFSLRRAVIAPPGYVLLAADYSQLEMRLMAELSRDPVLIDIFKRKGQCDCDVWKKSAVKNPEEPRCRHVDAHTRMAEDARISRQDAKPMNFGAIYGMGPFKLVQQIFKFSGRVIKEDKARKMLDTYFKTFKGVKQYHKWVNNTCIERGWIKTLLGRKRRLFHVNLRDHRKRGEAFRELNNASIQGSGADLLELASRDISVERAARAKDNPLWANVKFILNVHDEVVFQVPEAIAAEVKEVVVSKMENVVKLKHVPLVSTCAYGPSWEDAH